MSYDFHCSYTATFCLANYLMNDHHSHHSLRSISSNNSNNKNYDPITAGWLIICMGHIQKDCLPQLQKNTKESHENKNKKQHDSTLKKWYEMTVNIHYISKNILLFI